MPESIDIENYVQFLCVYKPRCYYRSDSTLYQAAVDRRLEYRQRNHQEHRYQLAAQDGYAHLQWLPGFVMLAGRKHGVTG